ncbi:MAG TPA: acyl-CoA synthetase [Trebonia sp.]|nr:acyl-CoA synthetase [Trebonia sp.]
MAAAPLTPSWQAERTPDAPAIIMGASGEFTTYAQLEDRSIRIARALRAGGVQEGDTIAILMENNRQYLEIAWAAQRSGLRYTAINNHLRPAEAQYVLDDCGAVALFSCEAMADVVSRLDLSVIGLLISATGRVPGFRRYEDFLSSVAAGPLDGEREGREMLYSSGTTGRPKGVRKQLPGTWFGDPRSAPAIIASGMSRYCGDRAVYLCPAPLYHSAPLVWSMSLQRFGATIVVMESFDPAQCLELIERHRVTIAQFVPTMFTRLLRLPQAQRDRHDVSSLRIVMHGAAPCPVDVKRQMLDWWGPIIHEYYAGTEDIGSTRIGPDEWLAHPGSVGKPADECHIVGPDGTELPAGEPGLVYFAGGRPFSYHNDAGKTDSITNSRGWRTLGDIGYLDSDGYLYLTDRQAHVIISGGVNIYPQEAENVLTGHPAVADVAVIGVPDAEMGESVKAVIQLADRACAGPELTAELLAYCRERLASYKCPRTIDFADQLPREPNGKLYKRRLRERYWAGHGSLVI